MAKNLKWHAVGRKGEKIMLKAPASKNLWGGGPFNSHGGGGGGKVEGGEVSTQPGGEQKRKGWTQRTAPRRGG